MLEPLEGFYDLCFRSANRKAIDLDSWKPHAYGHGLAILAAGTNPLVQAEVGAHHGNPREDVRTIADQGGSLYRPGYLTVFDQIGFASGKNELAARDIHLTAPK